MNESFVQINTFFEDNSNRTVDKLSLVYNNDTLLYNSIKSLLIRHIKIHHITQKRILIKPNWVLHNIKPLDKLCLCTNENVILATVKVILELKPISLVIGDAPIQRCKWELLLSDEFYKKVDNYSKQFNVPIQILDFRRTVFNPEENKLNSNKRTIDNFVIFDVGAKSYLEPITTNRNLFRVTNYNPDRLADSHSPEKHKYCIAKEVFDCDTIISIPKIKTHQKSGITNSLKIFVGVNGDKDFLPHHRIGSVEQGGDCYKGKSTLRTLSEWFLDIANKNIGTPIYKMFKNLSRIFWRVTSPTPEQNLAAGWYGNDTVWRMVLDINMIVEYGTFHGRIENVRQRNLYTLCDGIIGGQGNGPLSPDPLELGVLAFSNDSYLMDVLVGYLFKLNVQRIPLLNEALNLVKDKKKDIYINDELSTIEDVERLALNVIMPPGWLNYNMTE